MPLVIGLTGLAGSGKGEVAKYLVKKHNFAKFVFSDILKEEAKKRGMLDNKSYEQSKAVFSKLGGELREKSGKMEILAEMLVEKIKSNNLENVVVDGFRSLEEAQCFKDNFEKFYLIFVDTDETTRFERRNKEDPEADIESFIERDKIDINEKGLGRVIDLADFKVDNNEDIGSLFKQVEKILEKITGQDNPQPHSSE
jgi:dephospho-CoA kinase